MNKKEDITLFYGLYKSPVGDLDYFISENGIFQLSTGKDPFLKTQRCFTTIDASSEGWLYKEEPLGDKNKILNKKSYFEKSRKLAERLEEELDQYFDRNLRKFSLPFDLSFYTKFQLKVLSALTSIPYGKTFSYLDVARLIGCPKAFRAVGNAVGSNRLMIIIPCHRVIKNNGRMGKFGGGEDVKRFLLNLEGVEFQI
ncbi:MAG TPA: methylated-DNA--[protein]-cysteine S-methyltransferase [Exilispira sp.]|nr:methylated-DNA--[protein]-cysteine S-methyltransferase [Exilispira sp.]